jgi:hypothetical protein
MPSNRQLFHMKWDRLYFQAVGAILAVAIAGKIGALIGDAKLLSEHDPIFGVPNKALMTEVMLVEVGVLVFLIKGTKFLDRLLVTVWLFGCFAIYRLGLHLVDYRKPCSCLGNLADFAGVSDNSLDISLKIMVVSVLIFAALLVAGRTDTQARVTQVTG